MISAALLTACASTADNSASAAQTWTPWRVASPDDAGFDEDAVVALVDELRRGDHGDVDHFLLIRGGRKVVDERFPRASYATLIDQRSSTPRPSHDYSNADWHPYRAATELHTMQSVSKSVTSIGVGMAIADGALPGVDAKVTRYLDDVPVHDDARWSQMTVADLLTMRSGIDWTPPEGSVGYTIDHPTMLMEASQRWVPFVAQRPMRASPGTEFEYVDGASVLLGHVVHRAVGERIDAYLKRRLFDPIGIKEWQWKTSASGEVDTEGGLYLTAQGLARIGLLFLNDGRWNDTQIVPPEWVAQSTAPHVPMPDGGAYGYQWWSLYHEDETSLAYGAFGFGGQALIVDRETQTVAVFLGWDNSQDTSALFMTRILAALR